MSDELRIAPGTTLRVIAHSDELLHLQATYATGGPLPPAHLHPAQDERFEALAGTMSARVDGREVQLAQGEVLQIQRGVAHQMWNAGDEVVVLDWRTTPAGRTLDWFRALERVAAGDTSVDPAALLAEYADVFQLAEG